MAEGDIHCSSQWIVRSQYICKAGVIAMRFVEPRFRNTNDQHRQASTHHACHDIVLLSDVVVLRLHCGKSHLLLLLSCNAPSCQEHSFGCSIAKFEHFFGVSMDMGS